MTNVDVTIENETLILRINLREESGLTTSKRSISIASSGGNIPVWVHGKPHPRGIRFNCSVFRAPTPEEKIHGWKPLE